MGVQIVGEKKTREAASKTGLPIVRALRHSNRHWFCFCQAEAGHWHVAVDPVTWEWTLRTESAFTSCARYGPHVSPPEGLQRLSERASRADEEHARAERLTACLGFYADPRYYETQNGEEKSDVMYDRGALARASLTAEADE